MARSATWQYVPRSSVGRPGVQGDVLWLAVSCGHIISHVPLVDWERKVRCFSQCHVIIHTSSYLGRPGVQGEVLWLAVPRGNMYPGRLLVDRECKATCYGPQCHVVMFLLVDQERKVRCCAQCHVILYV